MQWYLKCRKETPQKYGVFFDGQKKKRKSLSYKKKKGGRESVGASVSVGARRCMTCEI